MAQPFVIPAHVLVKRAASKNVDKELVVVGLRSRRTPDKMFAAGIVEKGTENLSTAQLIVYSPNQSILVRLVEAYNELLQIKRDAPKQEK